MEVAARRLLLLFLSQKDTIGASKRFPLGRQLRDTPIGLTAGDERQDRKGKFDCAKQLETAMLEVRPIGIFSRDFGIEAEGQRIASLDVSHWREAGAISMEGQSYTLYREGLITRTFVLENEGQVIARATKPIAFRSRFDLEFNARRYSLRRTHVFGRSFSVFQDEAVVGSIHPTGVLTRKTIIDLPVNWPVPIQIFAFGLVLVIWNRDSRSGTSAVAAG